MMRRSQYTVNLDFLLTLFTRFYHKISMLFISEDFWGSFTLPRVIQANNTRTFSSPRTLYTTMTLPYRQRTPVTQIYNTRLMSLGLFPLRHFSSPFWHRAGLPGTVVRTQVSRSVHQSHSPSLGPSARSELA